MSTILITHAILAPIFFAGVSLVYIRRFNYTAPLSTAGIFISSKTPLAAEQHFQTPATLATAFSGQP
jgi:hypothetical protein